MTRPTVLTLNAGSSSLKFGLYDTTDAPVPLAMGLVERIGGAPRLKLDFGAEEDREGQCAHGPRSVSRKSLIFKDLDREVVTLGG